MHLAERQKADRATPTGSVSLEHLDMPTHRWAMGRPPKSLGSPELHHADQMRGADSHEVDPVHDRLPGNHPNKYNQGVTDAMRNV